MPREGSGLGLSNVTCEVVKCIKPPVENAVVHGNAKYNENEVLSYTCNPGYKRGQERDSKCTNSGGRAAWIPTPACEAIKCELTLPPVPGTTYEPAYRNRFSPGEKVRVSCGDRYWISDSRSRLAETTCEENGQWTVAPVCQEVTCSRPRERYISYSSGWQQIKLGDSVWYRCATGYRSTGGATWATCTRDGWEPHPLCQEIKCKKESYNNADIIGEIHSEYSYNDRVQYKCKRGYEGRFTLTCGENGWHRSNQCTATTQCQSVSSENRFDVWPSGNKLYYTCKDGYKLLTKGWWGEATCEGGVWSGLKDCIAERECGEPPVIPNGKGRLQTKPSQKSISITCKEGYSTEIEELTCNEGQWDLAGRSLDEICKPNDDNCSPPLKVENAVVTTPYQKEYPSGSTVTYQCRAKYTMESEATIECTAGKWDALEIKCIFTCDKLQDEWQTMNFTADKEKYKNGEIIKYQCKNKERSNGTATCQDGNWTKTIECEEKCTVPEIPSSLRFTTDSPRSQILKGQYLTFTCVDSTHIIKGNATFECLANGQWSDPLPTCEATRVCSTSPNLSNGQAKRKGKNQYSHNEKVEYVCRRGYVMEGGPSKTCINGEWIGEMRCRPAQGCTRPAPISDGGPKTATKSLYQHGDKVEYVCQAHYVMEGGPIKTCFNGEWTGEIRCLPAQGCTRPPPLLDGGPTTTTRSQYQHGDKVEYVCQAYYLMEGGPIKTCFNGEWTGEIRCLQPCTVTEEELNSHNIHFKHPRKDNPDKMYSAHNDVIEFVCTKGRRVGAVGMRQKCEHGVMELPTCQ
ncbi:complement factor H-like [Archocentrus centrarchus]|uniref:complement factor H-like n=1 Tax=Archocentrus centrarchus TaxID=63155 RepID=UPI0011E9CBAA|nr:complement factor H-like [Archocentrus centrarchus]